MKQKSSLLEENFWGVLDLAESKTKSPMDRLVEEDLLQKALGKIATLEREVVKAKKRLAIQSNEISVLARNFKKLEEKQ